MTARVGFIRVVVAQHLGPWTSPVDAMSQLSPRTVHHARTQGVSHFAQKTVAEWIISANRASAGISIIRVGGRARGNRIRVAELRVVHCPLMFATDH